MADRPKQRRPPRNRASFLADPPFIRRLKALLDEKSSEEVAAEVATTSGYKCSNSLVRKISLGQVTQSWLVGEIAKHYRWEMPPRAAGEMAVAVSALEEVRAGDDARYLKLVRMILRERDQLRDIAELGGDPENDQH